MNRMPVRSNIIFWILALLLPFVMVILLQFTASEIRPFRRMMDVHGFWQELLFNIFPTLIPSYVVISLINVPLKTKLIHAAVITALFVLYVPIIKLFAIYSSCYLFHVCP